MNKKSKHLKNGVLISVEGIDGSGKSSFVSSVVALLRSHDFDTIATKEPGATAVGKTLRAILQAEQEPLCPIGQYLLFAADRAEHFTQIVIPALKQKKIVVSDRMNDSSLAYQGYANGLAIEMISSIDRWAMQNISPDITFYIRIDVPTAIGRIKNRGEHESFYEKEEFLTKVSQGFETIFSDRKNICILDGNQSPATVLQAGYAYFKQWAADNQLVSAVDHLRRF